MVISGLGSVLHAPQGSAPTGKKNEASAADSFLSYLSETPAQQMSGQLLAGHHVTAQQLAAMPSAQREALNKQIGEDIKSRLNQQTQKTQSLSSI